MEVTLYNILYIIHILYIFHRFAKHPNEARWFHRLDVRLVLNSDLGESVETKIYESQKIQKREKSQDLKVPKNQEIPKIIG